MELEGVHIETLTNYSLFDYFGAYTAQVRFPFPISVQNIVYSSSIGSGFALTGTILGYTNDSVNLYALSTSTGEQKTKWLIKVSGYII